VSGGLPVPKELGIEGLPFFWCCAQTIQHETVHASQ
jgi:hypothetical protein